jgi:hypothetical protein
MDDREQALKAVLAEHPELQPFGFGAFNSRRKTAEQIRAEIEEGRASILLPHSLDEFEAARGWLRQFPKTARMARKGTSYGLKHVAEDTIGYCTNGVFIAAAIAEGFAVKRMAGSPNAWINISLKAWGRNARPRKA